MRKRYGRTRAKLSSTCSSLAQNQPFAKQSRQESTKTTRMPQSYGQLWRLNIESTQLIPGWSSCTNLPQLPSRLTTSSNIYLNFEISVADSSRWGSRYLNGNKMTDSSTA